MKFIFSLFFFFSPSLLCYEASSVSLKINNYAGMPIDLFWVNTFEPGRALVGLTASPIVNRTSQVFNSYSSHEFMIKFTETGEEGTPSSAEAHFTKGPVDEELDVYFDKESGVFRIEEAAGVTALSLATAAGLETCLSTHDIKEEGDSSSHVKCVADSVFASVARVAEEKARLKRYRSTLSERFRNYTCADPSLNTSEPIESFTYVHGEASFSAHVSYALFTREKTAF